MRYPNAQFILFSKEPREGSVKTRLIPAIGAQAATRLHCAMLMRVATTLAESGLAPWRFAVSGDPEHPIFSALSSPLAAHEPLKPLQQYGSDLGERMANAAKEAFAESTRPEWVVILGADCPAIDESILESALTALAGEAEVVFAPALDGGYVLLGMKRVIPALFEDLPWGTGEVLARSLERLERAGVRVDCLASLWDVDTPEDLARLLTLSPPLDGV